MFSLNQILGWYKGAMKARTIPAEATSATPATCETLEGRRLLSATPVYQAWEATEQNTHEAFDITRTYTDGSNQPTTFSQAFGAGNPALNLTLENVPAHAVISFGFVLQTNAERQTQNDADNLVVSVGGQQIFSADVSSNDYFVYGGAGPINHTGGTLPITFSTSGFDSNETSSIVEMNVSVYLPTITVESEVITVGETEEVTITATDDFGPVPGLGIDIESLDPSIISPQQSSVTTGQDGKAIVNVEGIAIGSALLQATTQSGGQGAATQQAKNPSITLSTGSVSIFNGQDIGVTATVKDAKGNLAANREIIATGGSGNVQVTGGTTNAAGEVTIRILGLKSTKDLANGNVTVTLKDKKAPTATAPLTVTVKKVLITLDAAPGPIMASHSAPNQETFVSATVTDEQGNPVRDVAVTSSITGTRINGNWSQTMDNPYSDAQGKVWITITTIARDPGQIGKGGFLVLEVGDEASDQREVWITP